ncbi:MAG TPA: carbohydrate ABC transporter permease [Acetobacteraceae bacterium]|jgi:multiple sugar transport system permease protein|nr:carbohydrate ABC transporter permease [Acetobacteraceae bacterium]
MSDILWSGISRPARLFAYMILLLAAFWVIFPALWAVVNSVKTTADTFRAGALIPFVDFKPTLASWRSVLGDPEARQAILSSTIVSLGTTIFVLLLGTPAAYSLARFFPRRSRDITLWFLSQRVLPPAVVLIPFYVMMVALRLIDTWTGLIFCYSTFNLAFGVVIMRDVFRDVSIEIEEAAKVEGATHWQIFRLIALPLAVDGLIVSAVIVFAFTWNEALFASALTSQHAMTMPAFILASRSTRGVDFNTASVNTLLAIMPPVILSFFVQRFLARGLSFGAVKG